MGGSTFKNNGILRGIFPGFMWDPYRITLEISKDPNVIILASLKESQEHTDSSRQDRENYVLYYI